MWKEACVDPLRAHLLLNHIPVIGVVLALLVLAAAMARRNNELARAACLILAGMALVGVPVFYTGEPAEDRVERLPGFSKTVIYEHEEAAEKAFIALSLLGAVALAGLGAFRRRPELPRWFVAAVLALALLSAGLLAWTANLGGHIRHTELLSAPGD